MTELPLLSLLIWVPIGGALLLLLLGDKNPGLSRGLALLLSLATLLLCIPLYTGFQTGTAEMQFVELASWVPSLKINYALGVDGFSMPLIILTSFSMVLVVIAGWEVIEKRPGQYMAAFLIMEGLMNGVFAISGQYFVLCFLGRHVNPDVPDHWYLGWTKPCLCNTKVFPLYLPGFSVHVSGTNLYGCHRG